MKGKKIYNYSKKVPIIKAERKFYIKVSILVFLVWVVLFELVGRYATQLPTYDITSSIDKQIPLVAQFIWPYLLCYIFPFLPLFVVKDEHRLNLTLLSIILANLSAFILYLIFPIAFPRPVLGQTLSDHLLSVLYRVDFYPGANKLPSLHVTFTWIVYLACRKQRLNKWGDTIVFSLAGLITLSALFVKQHLIADVIAGICWAFTAWSLAGNLYKSLIDQERDPRVGLKQMMKKLIPIMSLFVVVIFSIILFYWYKGHKLF
jgi:membrane-associated phospholipid phosphatase